MKALKKVKTWVCEHKVLTGVAATAIIVGGYVAVKKPEAIVGLFKKTKNCCCPSSYNDDCCCEKTGGEDYLDSRQNKIFSKENRKFFNSKGDQIARK